MPTDAYWAIAAAVGWILAAISAAYALGQARQLNDERRHSFDLSRRLQGFAPLDRDGDGKPGGSLKR